MNVEVDAAPQQALSEIMTEIRQHYETVADKNRKELENWFQTKVRLTFVTPYCPSPVSSDT